MRIRRTRGAPSLVGFQHSPTASGIVPKGTQPFPFERFGWRSDSQRPGEGNTPTSQGESPGIDRRRLLQDDACSDRLHGPIVRMSQHLRQFADLRRRRGYRLFQDQPSHALRTGWRGQGTLVAVVVPFCREQLRRRDFGREVLPVFGVGGMWPACGPTIFPVPDCFGPARTSLQPRRGCLAHRSERSAPRSETIFRRSNFRWVRGNGTVSMRRRRCRSKYRCPRRSRPGPCGRY